MPDAVRTDALLGGRYRLLHEVARGGMAAVWEAEDGVLGRRVAVKVLHSHLAADDAVRERFRREAIAVARLSHSAIVAVYDTGEDDGVAYLVMEMVAGRTLRDILREDGPLAVRTALEIVAQVAAGLAIAHERGIIHRDVKPANILVGPDGSAKITDFGIARGQAGTDLDEDLTRTGTVVGTARYLAPEQIRGDEIDARTDVYALGLVLYEALCGRPAFDGATEFAAAIARTQGGPLAPRQIRVEIPRDLEAIVLRAVDPEPDLRFQSASELRAALVAVGPLADEPTAVTYQAPSDRPFTLGALGIVGVAIAVTGAGFFFAGTGAGRSVLQGVRDRLPGGAAETVAIAAASDFDPEGDDRTENPRDVGLAHDGNPETAWETTRYNSPEFGRLKSGVGLVVRLADTHAVRRVVVQAGGGAWNAQIYVGDGTATDLGGWGEAVAAGEHLNERATFDIDRARGSAVLIWITRLPDSGRLAIAEVDVAA